MKGYVRKAPSYYSYSHEKFWIVDNTTVHLSTGMLVYYNTCGATMYCSYCTYHMLSNYQSILKHTNQKLKGLLCDGIKFHLHAAPHSIKLSMWYMIECYVWLYKPNFDVGSTVVILQSACTNITLLHNRWARTTTIYITAGSLAPISSFQQFLANIYTSCSSNNVFYNTRATISTFLPYKGMA